MEFKVRVNKHIEMYLDITAYNQWISNGRQGEAPTLFFGLMPRTKNYKTTMSDVEDVNKKLDELWEKYRQLNRFPKPEIKTPQEIFGENHTAVLQNLCRTSYEMFNS
jgi:hypothetical protein